MIYYLSNTSQVKEAQLKLNWLIKHGKKIELTEKRKRRSLNQNSYLHVVLSFYGTKTGYTLEEVKQDIFKRNICRNMFLKHNTSPVFDVYRSTADLNTKEMADAIERFRNHASQDLGIYIPEPHEEQFLQYCQEEIDRHKQYL